MSFARALQSVLTRYADFTGRARASEFWWWILFTVLVGLATGTLDRGLGTTRGDGLGEVGLVTGLVSIVLLLPTVAVSVRRLHDTGRSGWWTLIGLVPVAGYVVLIVFLVQEGQPRRNRHGPDPKAWGHDDAEQSG